MSKSNIHKSSLFSLLLFFAILLVSCSSLANSPSQNLQAQIYALETQNALILSQLNNEQSNIPNSNPEATPLPALPDAPSNTSEVVTATAESLPTSPIEAGIPVIYDGWALTLTSNIDTGRWNGDDYFNLYFVLRNMSDQPRVFRYIKAGINVTDNLGNYYPFSMADSSCENTPDNIQLPAQLTVDAGDTQSINSMKWEGCSNNHIFPPLKGILPVNASQLIITIDSWGPFSGITYYLNL